MDQEKLVEFVGWAILSIAALCFVIFAAKLLFQMLRFFYELIIREPCKSEITAIDEININKGGGVNLALVIAGAVFIFACFTPEKPIEPIEDIDKLQYELSLRGADIEFFRCDRCDKITTVCQCHADYGYPEDYCCDCAREDYKICFICGKATCDYSQWEDETGERKDLYYCWNCAQEYSGTGKLICIDGKGYYLEDALPK